MSTHARRVPVASRIEIAGSSGSESPRENLDPLLVLQRVGENAREQVVLRFGRMPRHAEGQRLVHAAVGVGEVDVEVMDGRRQCHR